MKNQFKKISALLLAIIMLLSFAACGDKKDDGTTAPQTSATETTKANEGKDLSLTNGEGVTVNLKYAPDFTFNEANTDGNFLAQQDLKKVGTLESKEVNIGFAFGTVFSAYSSTKEYLEKSFSKHTIFEETEVNGIKAYIHQNLSARMQVVYTYNEMQYLMVEFTLPQGATKEDYANLKESDNFKNLVNSVKFEIAEVKGEPITSEKGYVTVTPCGGWTVNEDSQAPEAISFKNEAYGKNAGIYVYDLQDKEYDIQKKTFEFAFSGQKYEEKKFGNTTFEVIQSAKNPMIYAVAKTSTGQGMYVYISNATLDQAKPVLETIVIK